MNLTTHPVVHYALELVFYHAGLLCNVLIAAHLSTGSKNNGINTIGGYFRMRWIPLTVRWLACVFLFMVVWENSAMPLNNVLEKLMNGYLAAHLGTSGFLGFGCDEFFAKITALLGIQRELPAIPPADQP